MTRERDNIADELAAQRRQNEELVSQQNNWDDLRRASEQIQALTQLVGQADNEEIKELRRIRDRSKILEGEHLALQRRMKEYETKMMSNEKVTQTSRQSLVQAQQRAIEWEKRAKEYEAELETTRTKLDNAEQAHAQIETDYSLVKLQLEERDAEERLDKVRSCLEFLTLCSTIYRIGKTNFVIRSLRWKRKSPAYKLRQTKPRKRLLLRQLCNPPRDIRTEMATLVPTSHRVPTPVRVLSMARVARVPLLLHTMVRVMLPSAWLPRHNRRFGLFMGHDEPIRRP